MVDRKEYTPGKLPSNEYAFKNALFVSPEDYKGFL